MLRWRRGGNLPPPPSPSHREARGLAAAKAEMTHCHSPASDYVSTCGETSMIRSGSRILLNKGKESFLFLNFF